LRKAPACQERSFLRNSATAVSISSGLSAWMKWVPLTVIWVRFDQVRTSSRMRPRTSAPGSALMNGSGTSASANHLP
jgi:hypothetical protein